MTTVRDIKPSLRQVLADSHVAAVAIVILLLFSLTNLLHALAETRNPVSLRDYAGRFFLLWLFPVGVWIIQPRVNPLFGEFQAVL